jgi:hypothetical protein
MAIISHTRIKMTVDSFDAALVEAIVQAVTSSRLRLPGGAINPSLTSLVSKGKVHEQDKMSFLDVDMVSSRVHAKSRRDVDVCLAKDHG